MACKGCKSKKIDDLIDEKSPNLPKQYKILILIYTILCVYGLISIIFDIVSLFN